ncbi:unnamed protein product [Cochlearia groenlandica]
MSMVSWFPPDSPSKKVNIEDDVMFGRVVHYAIGGEALTLFIVRSDDFYVGRHKNMRGYTLNDVDDDDDSDSSKNENEGGEEETRNAGLGEEELAGNDGLGEEEIDGKLVVSLGSEDCSP